MTTVKRISLVTGIVLASAGAVLLVKSLTGPPIASKDTTLAIYKKNSDSTYSQLNRQVYGNPGVKLAILKQFALSRAADSAIIVNGDYSTPPDTTKPPTTNPGGKSSNPVSYSGLNGTTITGLSFDGGGRSVDLITLNNCHNVHITLCRFSNTNGIPVRLINCSNITTDYNFFTMTGFGVDAVGCTGGIKTNHNQGLNLWAPVKYNSNFAHWVQYYKCSGPDMQINDNALQSVDGVAVHPHDAISIDLTSGTAASPIQILHNRIRGGQVAGGWPGTGDTGVGITAPDEGGSYYVIRGNTVVNSGVNGILCVTTSAAAHILVDSNTIVNDSKTAKVAYDGFTCTGVKTDITVSNNKVRWLTNKGTYTGYWFNGASTIAGGKLLNNNWNDATLSSNVLPASIITYK